MAKAPDPRRLAAQRRAEAYKSLRWEVLIDGGPELEWLPSQMTGLDSAELQRQAGFSERDLIGRLAPDRMDLAAAAAVVWLARRHAGEQVTYDEVAAGLTLGDETVVTMADIDGEGGTVVPLNEAASRA